MGIAELFGACGLPADGLGSRLEELRRSGAVLLAHEWGPPSGIVAAHWHRALLGPERRATIDLLLVAPDARRRGIGRLLIKGIAQAARAAGCGALCMALPHGATDLAAFADASGFDSVGTLRERALRRGSG